MNGRMALQLKNKARRHGRDGSVVISDEYDRLKHEYKHPETPWPKEKKLSRYQIFRQDQQDKKRRARKPIVVKKTKK